MKNSALKLFKFFVIGLFWSMSYYVFAQETCSISSNASNYCVGQNYFFYTDAPGDTYSWYLNGQLVYNSNTGQPFRDSYVSISISYAGTYTLAVQATSSGGGINPTFQTNPSSSPTLDGGCYATIEIQVGDFTPAYTINAIPPAICESGNVQLSITNSLPGGNFQQQLQWSSNPVGYSGTGSSLQVNGLNKTTTFNLVNNNAGCFAPNSISVIVYKTNIKPVANIINAGYRKVIIPTTSGSQEFSQQHYWQVGTSATDLNKMETELPVSLSTPFIVTKSGFYYIRSYSSYTACWTNASNVIQVSVSTTPPRALISQIKRYGYNELYISNDDLNILTQNADYYVVSSLVGTEKDQPFTGNKFLAYEEKVIYIRGVDKETQTWGSPLAFTNTLRSDDDLNWVWTKSYDGTASNNLLSESKSFFDQRGQALQSQTKIKHNGEDKVFASQSLKDKFDRAVGNTLSAPIAQTDFKYNEGFVMTDEGKPFSYSYFDTPNKIITNKKGTLGHYYSTNNTSETNVPLAAHTFSRTDFYEDGTGEEKKSAQPGDVHFIGSGREVLKGTFPIGNSDVANELTDYLTKRSIVFGTTQPTKLEGVQTVVRDENGRFAVSISDKSGKTLMTARKGAHPFSSSVSSDKMAYFYVLGDPATSTDPLLQTQSITVDGTSDYLIENTVTNSPITKLTSALPHTYILSAGYYRVVPTTGTVTVTYKNYFSDIAYQFYNDAGRLISSVSPNGYEQWISGGSTQATYATIDKSVHEYNHQGWLMKMTETDAGSTSYLYRKDGKIRFSQNAKQSDVNNGSVRFFSYTNYDDLGRPVESGESSYSSSTNFGNLITSLEAIGNGWMSTIGAGARRDWVETGYDYPVGTGFPSLPSEYTQNYIRGAVSFTKNANTKTWYSYDEMGRVVWMAQKPEILNFPFTYVTNYEYDFLGNVLKTYTRAYNGSTWRDAFYHHYEYDANKRLQKVSTSLDGVKKTVQAEYTYYLHGPLKRVVLATNLQGIDFVYNIHGWLTQINDPNTTNDPGKDGTNGIRKDVFGMILEYYSSSIGLSTQVSSVLDQNNPNRFHKIPSVQPNSDSEVADAGSPLDSYRNLMKSNFEQLKKQWEQDEVKMGSSGGGN